MIINFITYKIDKNLLKVFEKLYDGFSIRYKSGNYEKNIIHYLEYKCPTNINIFYGYITNLLIDYSQNNLFVFDKNTYIQSWTPQLHNYDLILVQNEEDLIIDSFMKKETINMNMNVKDVNIFYKSIIQVCKKMKSIKLPQINNFMDPKDLPNISLCMPTYNRKKL